MSKIHFNEHQRQLH